MDKKFTVTIDADLEDIVPTFLKNRQQDLQVLQKALEDRDLKVFETIGHRLAGNAGGYGFDGLGEIGAKMESAARSGSEVKGFTFYIEEIKEYLDNVEIVYQEN